MKKASLVVNPVFQNDIVFDPKSPWNRDDCLAFYRDLKLSLAQRGYELRTQDIHPIESSDLVIYNDMPRHRPPLEWAEKSHLLIFESHLIRAKNWSRCRHRAFRTVLTWNDDWVDGKKYFKFNFSHRFPKDVHNSRFERSKLAGVIAGAHVTFHPLELYSERLRTIQWFEKNHPDQFVLYGRGWDRILFTGPIPVRMLNFVPGLRSLCTTRVPSWKGPVNNKMQTFDEFRFAVCYENAEKITGYITEKIFDCLFAGVIPVYWGAPNIAKSIPTLCYVDRQDFASHEELYRFLTAMSASEHAERMSAIRDYLHSKQADSFRAEVVAEQVARVVTGAPPIL